VAHVRPLTASDLDAALTLSSSAGWNQRIDDWRMLLTIAPHGSFAALDADRLVGTAIGIDYGGFGWIAMMLVYPEYRGRGLGKQLLEAAMDAVPPDRPIRLDATPMGRPLYQRYGFEDEVSLTRQIAAASSERKAAVVGTSFTVRALAPDELAGLATRDRDVFGGDRHAVLRWLHDATPHYAFAVGDGPNDVQYILGRSGRLFEQIGPVVAADVTAAQALVSAALDAASGKAIVVDSFDPHAAFGSWLRDVGFSGQRPLFRMRRLARQESHAPTNRARATLTEFAILGPEFG
jgi:GNAT superfamily N-acetyltransferase